QKRRHTRREPPVRLTNGVPVRVNGAPVTSNQLNSRSVEKVLTWNCGRLYDLSWRARNSGCPVYLLTLCPKTWSEEVNTHTSSFHIMTFFELTEIIQAENGSKHSQRPSPASRYDQCPPDKDELGRSTWNLLHTMSVYYPEKPTEIKNRRFLRLWIALQRHTHVIIAQKICEKF
ncbi:hypothetical protein OSTOST_03649, partial [Ostertagia ostertagi]